MATIQELKEKIMAIDEKIGILKREKDEVKAELKDATQAAFEAQMMIKPGDPIQTKLDETVFYDGFVFDSWGGIVILCHPKKKDGTASQAILHYMWGDFK